MPDKDLLGFNKQSQEERDAEHSKKDGPGKDWLGLNTLNEEEQHDARVGKDE
jgi:hypothetical protein